jgi:lipopolysaccharide/colanic/teichoic acid biosynthesis glycosyltransferase
VLKRAFDFSASLVGLIVFSPLLAVVAIWVKLDSRGLVFYRASRGGRFGKPFKIFKFRSMVANADKIGGPSTSGSDARVTRSGRFIRKCKLDELSQLINVLIGDMSIVGPRPEIVSKVEKYTEEERNTLKLRPGITDWASIWNSDEGGVLDGARDADAVYEEVIRPTKMKLQIYYCQTRSFLGDLKIICLTLVRIVCRNWTPKELRGYPSFDELRSEALKVIERQKQELSVASAPTN